MNSYKKIAIIGAGCYGTALAQCFSKKIDRVLLLSNVEDVYNIINQQRTHPSLPDAHLRENISCTMNYEDIVDADLVFIVVPVSAVLSVCSTIKEKNISVPVILCSKGIDAKNLQLLSFSVEKILQNDVVVLSGPSFAAEIVADKHAGVNVAGKNMKLCRKIAKNLTTDTFTITPIKDYVSLQIAGAFKNILAIGCGILCEMQCGNSAISKLITLGINEMTELAKKQGGEKSTFLELGIIGDIILTCTSEKSRNFTFGKHVSYDSNSINNWLGNLAEGAFSAATIPALESKYHVKLPVFHWIRDCIYESNIHKSSFFESSLSERS